MKSIAAPLGPFGFNKGYLLRWLAAAALCGLVAACGGGSTSSSEMGDTKAAYAAGAGSA